MLILYIHEIYYTNIPISQLNDRNSDIQKPI